jgi:uncharacterized membrane protein YkvA (DUF1232 family)
MNPPPPPPAPSGFEEDIRRANENADQIGSKFQKAKALKSLLAQGMTMISLVRDYTTGRYREVPHWVIGVAAMALLYVLSPIDIIPDVFGGFIDDAVVVAFSLRLIQGELDRYSAWKIAAAEPASATGDGIVVDV